MILVDTSVWIDWLREGSRPATALLDRLIDEEDILTTPVVVQELLQGARGPEHLQELREHFLTLPQLMPSLRTYTDAGTLYTRCRWSGITARSPHDCLIARIAIEHAVPLLQDDRDFELIARVEPALRLLETRRNLQ